MGITCEIASIGGCRHPRAHRFRRSADPLTQNDRFSEFLHNGSAVWRLHRLTSGPHHSQSGGIALHEAPTRRRHAPRGLHVVQTPPPLPARRAPEGLDGPEHGARGWRWGLAGQHADTPTDWRPTRGLQGLAGLRADAPSEARGADGERAGRPRGGRRSVGATSSNSQGGRIAGGPSPTAQHGPQDRTCGARNTGGATSKARNKDTANSEGPEAPQRLGPLACQWLTG